MEKTCGVVAFVPDVWGDAKQARHYVMWGLSEHYKILWVSPPTYVEGWRRGGVGSSLRGRGLKKLSDRFWAYAPCLPADYKRRYGKSGVIADGFRTYHRIWQAAYERKVKRLLRAMGIDRVILYIWRPEFHWALGRFGEALSCYHIDDEYSFDPARDQPISPEEEKLLIGSDLVFIHSKTLMEKKGNLNRNTHYLPNGVDFGHYRRVIEEKRPEPDDLTGIPHPRIGYMGHVKRHINLPLLSEIARKRPNWSLVFIGPVRESHEDIREDIAVLEAMPNVHFLGGKPAKELPRYVQGIDVCLMPYRKTAYTKYIYPMKMHEYFACGKPVVATELENLKEFAQVLDFAEGCGEWITAIDRYLRSFPEEQRRKRIGVAEANSWAKRVEVVARELQRMSEKLERGS